VPRYPFINFLLRHGQFFAAAVGLLPVGGALCLAYFGGSWTWMIAGIVLGAVLYVIARSYVELVALIADMLLPK
jgi:glucose dehydrogenase